MIGKISVSLLLLFALSKAQLDVDLGGLIKEGMQMDITENVQNLLPQMNEFVKLKNMASIKLPDVRCKRQSTPIFSGVTFVGLDSMEEAINGEATITGPNSLNVDTSILFNDTKLVIAKAGKTQTALTWDIGSLVIDLSFSMLPKKSDPDQCYTKYTLFKINDMSDIVQHSTDSELDGSSPKQEVVDKVVRYYNQILRSPRALRRLGVLDICEPSPSTISQVVNFSTQTVV